MPIEAEYKGMPLRILDNDAENREFFAHAAAHDFHLQACTSCRLLRYPPAPGCPWCATSTADWKKVEGRGVVHTYTEVTHAIQPGFKGSLPYMVLIVELDTQNGVPTEHEALRVTGNLVDPDGAFASPETVARVGIGTRVRMVFTDIGPGMALPQWTIDETAEQPAKPWRYPE